jgi:hypothetical protein
VIDGDNDDVVVAKGKFQKHSIFAGIFEIDALLASLTQLVVNGNASRFILLV